MAYPVPPKRFPAWRLKTFPPSYPTPGLTSPVPRNNAQDLKRKPADNRATVIGASVAVTAILMLALIVVIFIALRKRRINEMRLRNSKEILETTIDADVTVYDDVVTSYSNKQDDSHYEVVLSDLRNTDECAGRKSSYCDLGAREEINHYEELTTESAGENKSMSEIAQVIQQQKKLLIKTHGERFTENEYEYWASMIAKRRHSSIYVQPQFQTNKGEAIYVNEEMPDKDERNNGYLTVLP